MSFDSNHDWHSSQVLLLRFFNYSTPIPNNKEGSSVRFLRAIVTKNHSNVRQNISLNIGLHATSSHAFHSRTKYFVVNNEYKIHNNTESHYHPQHGKPFLHTTITLPIYDHAISHRHQQQNTLPEEPSPRRNRRNKQDAIHHTDRRKPVHYTTSQPPCQHHEATERGIPIKQPTHPDPVAPREGTQPSGPCLYPKHVPDTTNSHSIRPHAREGPLCASMLRAHTGALHPIPLYVASYPHPYPLCIASPLHPLPLPNIQPRPLLLFSARKNYPSVSPAGRQCPPRERGSS